MRGGRVTAPAALRDSARQRSAGLRPAIRVERSGDGGTSPDKSESRRLGLGRPPSPDRPALRAGLPKCGESRTETPEQEGLGSGDPTPSRSWLGNRNSLARLRRAAASSDWSLLICERGGPFHTFPPVTQAANGVRCHCFLRARQYATTPKKRGNGLERRPLGSSPGGARHSWPQASGRRIAAPPHDAARVADSAGDLCGMAPQGKDTAVQPAGERRPPGPQLLAPAAGELRGVAV